MPWAAAAGAVASVAGSAISAGMQSDAGAGVNATSRYAADLQKQMFDQIQQNLAPYMGLGTTGIGKLMGQAPAGTLLGSGSQSTGADGTSLLDALTSTFNPTMQSLENTPGYQFQLGQGLRATQNALTTTGLGGSGNAVKAATDYATGLAGTTYQQQFGDYLAQNNQIWNQLSSLIGTGENAAAGVGNAGMQTTNSISSLLTGGANAAAAGQIGAGNALASGLGGAGNSALLAMLLKQNGGGGGNNLTGVGSNTNYVNNPANYSGQFDSQDIYAGM